MSKPSATSSAPIRARNGLRVVPDHTLASALPTDVLIVPGGYGTRALLTQPVLIDWVHTRATQSELVLSVCTGALVLGQAGLLDALSITTHHSALDRLATMVPSATVDGSRRFHDNGRIVTAAGISAGIDASLHVVRRLCVVSATLPEMEYQETSR
ncbi:MAG: DJ-1/PfpI family protein [Candidatus Synoicihabitans palmerolidicus]|nr:DJ-1/PfpI family protein [Candidatus Synoicihabitans palmerolidicus]